jgi:hypothetical protein
VAYPALQYGLVDAYVFFLDVSSYLFVNNAFYKAVHKHVTNHVSLAALYGWKTIIKWTFTGYEDVNSTYQGQTGDQW